MMIKVELKGAWASKMDLPKISSFVAVLLQGASWERAGDAVSSLVFRQGVKMKWGKHSIDTFTRESLYAAGGEEGRRERRAQPPRLGRELTPFPAPLLYFSCLQAP